MASRVEDGAWDQFLAGVQRARPRTDGMIPVGLILIPPCHEHDHSGDDDGVCVSFEGPVMILWPPGFTQEQKAAMLRRAANSVLTREPLR